MIPTACWPNIARAELIARLRRVPGIELAIVESTGELLAAVPRAQVLVIASHGYDRRVAEALASGASAVKFVQLLTAGYEEPQRFGVPPGVLVANAGDSWSPAVADHAMTLLLALARRLPQILENQAKRGWSRGFAPAIDGLEGKTLAVIGFGSIGREVARRARAFGMRVIAVTRSAKPHPLADEAAPAGALREALARADALVLAVPLSPQTRHMIGARELAACKPGALLVNVARGGLVDAQALGAALRSGRIGGAGLDVTEPEPLPPDHPLWDSPNLIVSPHVAGAGGATGRARLAGFVGENLERFAAGREPAHLVAV